MKIFPIEAHYAIQEWTHYCIYQVGVNFAQYFNNPSNPSKTQVSFFIVAILDEISKTHKTFPTTIQKSYKHYKKKFLNYSKNEINGFSTQIK
jgi:hypothetical protein